MNAIAPRSNCPLSLTLEMFGDKWSLLLLRDMLIFGKSRYGEFLLSPEGISTNILASRLKHLETCGLLEKLPDPADRKASRYLPTGTGLSLLPVLLEILCWGRNHFSECGLPDFVLQGLQQGREQLIAECETRLHNARLTLAADK